MKLDSSLNNWFLSGEMSVSMFGHNSVQTGEYCVQKWGEYGQFLLEKGNVVFWTLATFLSVYKIIVCKIRRQTTFSVFSRSVLLHKN